MTSLRERALDAYKQRDELYEQKRLIALKGEIQRILGIAVEPTENLIQVEGYYFRMQVPRFGGRDDCLHAHHDPDAKTNDWEPVRSLADLGDAIELWEYVPGPDDQIQIE